jgi:hypothetical protein
MQRGILGQFRGARDLLYGLSLSLSPAQDRFWHYFAILETILNFTKAALKKGGFIPRRVFLFKNM